MNVRIIAKTLGMLVGLIGLAMGACTFFAWADAEFLNPGPLQDSALHALGISTIVALAIGIILITFGKRSGKDILRREAIIIVGISWLLSALVGALPYMLCDPGLSPVKAFFESTSGLTTTGSTVMEDIESFPDAILLWRSVSQFLGGIGILVLFVAVLSFLGVGSRSLMQQESSLNISDSNASRIRDVAKVLLGIYLALTAVCGIGLFALGMPVFEAVCHAMTTVATGGFSPKNASIGHYENMLIEGWISIFMILGSLGFMLYVFFWGKNWKRIRAEEEAKFYLIMLLAAVVTITVDLHLVMENEPLDRAFHEAFFNVISISSTTGFAVSDYDQWPLFSRMALIILMIIGGCAGSTAGGVKMNRMILFKRIAEMELIKTFRPNQITRIKLNGVAPDKNVFVTTTLFLALAFVMTGFCSLIVALLEPQFDLISSVGAVMATIFNTGPGFESVGPTDNFGGLKDITLILLSLLMIVGRLEFFAILVLFVPALWKKY